MITAAQLYDRQDPYFPVIYMKRKYFSNFMDRFPLKTNVHAMYGENDVQWTGHYLSTFFNYLEIFQVAIVGIFVLLIALFFPRSGRFTRFLNKLSFEYVSLVLFFTSFDFVERGFHLSLIPDRIYSPEHLPVLKKGNWISKFDLFALVLQNEYLYTKIFIFVSLIALAITFYGVADRFFIANSYDIEFTILVFLIYIGSVILFLAHTLIEFALALEVITLGSYGLAAYERKSKFSSYAGVQYFIIGSIPSGMLVLSLALMYKTWGTLAIEDIDVLLNKMVEETTAVPQEKRMYNLNQFYMHANYPRGGIAVLTRLDSSGVDDIMDNLGLYVRSSIYWTGQWNSDLFERSLLIANNKTEYLLRTTMADRAERLVEWQSVHGNSDHFASLFSQSFINEKQPEMVLALVLLLFNLLFKITAAPFNFWAPSVYGNAPVASVTFLSIFSKVAVIFALVKLLATMLSSFQHILLGFLLFVGVFSLIFGMAGAFAEKTIKRFFVYSSMGHVGFMVTAMAVSNVSSISAVFHYLFIYFISSYLMWFVLIVMGRSRTNLAHFGSLKNIDKWVATAFALLIFSMSGIPPLGGFFVKLDVLIALLDSSQYYINFLLLFFSVISFFYYLRLIKIIYFDERKDYIRDTYISEDRLWMIAVLFVILLFYMFLVHKPLLTIERNALETLLNS